MKRVKEETEAEDCEVMHHVSAMSVTRLRKMVECVFSETPTILVIYSTVAKMKGDKRSTEGKLKVRNTYAFMVKKKDCDYKEILNNVKNIVTKKNMGDAIRGVRSIKEGKLLITKDKNKEAKEYTQNVDGGFYQCNKNPHSGGARRGSHNTREGNGSVNKKGKAYILNNKIYSFKCIKLRMDKA